MNKCDRKLYGSATVGTKGQIVIPAEARSELDIKSGDKMYVIASGRMKWVGLIKEDQLRQLIDDISENIDGYKNVLDDEVKL